MKLTFRLSYRSEKREREGIYNYYSKNLFFADDDRLQSPRHELHPSLIDQVQISQRSVTEELTFKSVARMGTKTVEPLSKDTLAKSTR